MNLQGGEFHDLTAWNKTDTFIILLENYHRLMVGIWCCTHGLGDSLLFDVGNRFQIPMI